MIYCEYRLVSCMSKKEKPFFLQLKAIVESNNSLTGKIFDIFILTIIVLSLITFSIETLPDLAITTKQYLRYFEVVSVILFTIEYALRIIVADSRPRFVFSFYGLIDLIAILPFYLQTGVDLRSIRIFRLLRVFRLLKIFRYSRAIQRFKNTFVSIKAELALFMLATVMLLYVSAVGIYYFENKVQPEVFKSIFHSLWWAVATLTTVGYGDVYPITAGGKTFTFVMLMVGLGVIAVPTGLIASAMTKAIEDEKKSQ